MLTTSPAGLNCVRPVPASLATKSVTSHARLYSGRRQRLQLATRAELGGSGQGNKKPKDKGFISAEEEPDEFFITKAESAGGLAPLKDPIAIVGILGILLPFIILGVAIATGYIDTSPKSALTR